MNKSFFILFLFLISYSVSSQKKETSIAWKKIDKGLFSVDYKSPQKAILGNQIITIIKINPKYYNFNLLSAKEKGEHTRTAKDWAITKKQIAVINAGMYQADHATNLGYMKDYNFSNNNRLNKDNTIIAFNRKDSIVPEIQIIDRTCQNWEELKNKYNSFSQSIRMVDCNQKNRWGQQNKKWSMVVIAIDKKENALFVSVRSPYSVHDFINTLLKAPLNIKNIMYLEGGPEASLYLNHNGKTIEKMGSYETGFNENDNNNIFWRIPNVIGITKK